MQNNIFLAIYTGFNKNLQVRLLLTEQAVILFQLMHILSLSMDSIYVLKYDSYFVMILFLNWLMLRSTRT